MTLRPLQFLIIAAAGLCFSVDATESEPKSATGIERIQLATNGKSISPGEEITVALVMVPAPGYHIYWRGPGIVGVAPVIKWILPDGFEPGPIEWPVPEKVDMAGIVANGYKSETWLLTRIRCPGEIQGDTITFQAECAWMACAKSCHPNMDSLSLVLPVTDRESETESELTERFANVRSNLPSPAPPSWKQEVKLAAKNQIDLTLTIPGFPREGESSFTFFCEDMQVDSDSPMTPRWIDRASGILRISFVRPDFAPKNPARFSGLLHSSLPFPESGSHWAELSLPWPKGVFPDE
ncbi:MAG: protein-disulfide reductase DsbD family protein [Verrucomicrobiales bacterium]|nr:protein-disulfide reductase DsbD family protein [Verrucomicrobiales bacterium]